jgi:hypothetical protein
MRRTATLLVIVLLATAASSCYRTRYVNLRESEVIPPASPVRPEPVSRWQHFFVFGWFPIERKIDAGKACGGPENVEAIETRRTFLQGLIAAFAGFYVNIYSPYNGEVVCRGAIRR